VTIHGPVKVTAITAEGSTELILRIDPDGVLRLDIPPLRNGDVLKIVGPILTIPNQ
jgi:hypothetical protein